MYTYSTWKRNSPKWFESLLNFSFPNSPPLPPTSPQLGAGRGKAVSSTCHLDPRTPRYLLRSFQILQVCILPFASILLVLLGTDQKDLNPFLLPLLLTPFCFCCRQEGKPRPHVPNRVSSSPQDWQIQISIFRILYLYAIRSSSRNVNNSPQ